MKGERRAFSLDGGTSDVTREGGGAADNCTASGNTLIVGSEDAQEQ
jgi:hypothetical protein